MTFPYLANPFDKDSQLDLNAIPFDPANSKNPFIHPNDSAFSIDSQDTERGLGSGPSAGNTGGTTWGFEGPAGAGTTGGVMAAGRRTAGGSDFAAREAQLRAREEEVRRREEALGMKENNWPPCKCLDEVRLCINTKIRLSVLAPQDRWIAR